MVILAMVLLSSPQSALGATLGGMNITTAGGGLTRVIFSFVDSAPNYHIDGDGTDTIVVTFTGAIVGNSLRLPAGAGIVNSISVRTGTASSSLGVTLHLGHSARLVTNLQNETLTVDLAEEVAVAYRDIGGATSGGDTDGLKASYVVVPLQYADVSEVAGILAEGASVLPTDNFIPSGSVFALPTSVNGASQIQSAQSAQSSAAQGSYGQRVSPHVAVDRASTQWSYRAQMMKSLS